MSGRRCAGGGAACAGAAAEAMEPAARELFEACRNGDVERVKRLVTPEKVNSRDTAGRKSTPLHFAAGNPRGAASPRAKPHLRAGLAGSPARLSPLALRAWASPSHPEGVGEIGEGAARSLPRSRCVFLWLCFVSSILGSTSGLAPLEGLLRARKRGRGRPCNLKGLQNLSSLQIPL